MNITINSQSLATELRLLNKVAPSKPAIQILGYILLQAAEHLTLCATDLEIGLVTTCPAQVHEPGRVALPAAHFLAMVEQFENADVSLALQGSQVLVKCGAFKSRLQAADAEDFPAVPVAEGSSSTLDMGAFQRTIERTRYAINGGSSKAVLQGALLTLVGPAAALAATDGKRLALATMSQEGADARVIIPAKTLDMLAAHADGGDVEMLVGQQLLFFKVGERLLFSRMMEGAFPKYDAIIPRNNDKTVTVNRVGLAAALRRVRLVSPESKAMYLTLEPGAIGLASSSAEVGSADESVAATYEGEPLKVCINGNNVLDFLEAASGQSVSLALKDARTAMLLMDGEDHLGVVMLMRN